MNPSPAPLRIASAPMIDIPDSLTRNALGQVTLRGQATPGASLRLFIDGVLVPATFEINSMTGAWTVTVTLSPGSHTIRVEDSTSGSDQTTLNVLSASAPIPFP
jgi:hypothetical protein